MTTHAERLNEIADWLDELFLPPSPPAPQYAASLRAAAEAFEKLGHAEDCFQRVYGSLDIACNCPKSENAS